VDDIAARLTETFDVAYETARQDVEQVMRQLQALRLLEAGPGEPVCANLSPKEA
jgi:hypothetical protein